MPNTGPFVDGTTRGYADNLNAAFLQTGTYAALPAAAQAGRLYFATDTHQLLRDTGAAWVEVTPGFHLVGVDSTERSTQSTTDVDLSTISGLNIAVTEPVLIVASVRGVYVSGTAAFNVDGLKLNSTTVRACDASFGAFIGAASFQGMISWLISPRSANYLRNGIMDGISSAITTPRLTGLALDADAPNAAITSLAIRAKVADAANTVYIKDVRVYVGVGA